jgi:hypothetical protein
MSPSSSHQWLSELNRAIQLDDDHGMWRLLEQHQDPVEAHHKLATQIARLAYVVQNRPRFSEIFLVPVLEMERGAQIGNSKLWRQADLCLGEALDIWLPPKTRKTVFADIRPYDWVGTWRPGILRSHLTSAVPGVRGPKLRFVTEEIECPQEAPRLGFVCIVLTQDRGWPQLPPADTIRDNRFKQVVSYALQGPAGQAAPTVLTPDRVQFAVADGLCLWLHLLNESVPIKGWTVGQVPSNPDVVKITIALEHETVPFTQFTVRKHQIGLQGLDAVLFMLGSIAPTLDHPMDLPPHAQEAVLDLT